MLIRVLGNVTQIQLAAAFASVGLVLRLGEDVDFEVRPRIDKPTCKRCGSLAVIYDSRGLLCAACAIETTNKSGA